MLKQIHDKQSIPTPFLVGYASKRTSSPEITGYYSTLLAMWVVNIDGREAPLIDQKNSVTELATKTLTERETDDQEDILTLAELTTKTDAQVESDDTSMSASLELATKTEAEMEHDDTSSDAMGMFL